jgi:type II secretory ATPase GspE/PulE/Tfp pilus assembly ATPase PilB-like protein
MLPMTGEVRSAVARSNSVLELAKIGASAGYEPMMSEGLRMVARGETSRSELERVLGSGEF